MGPTMAIASDTMRTGPATITRSLVADWHELTKAFHPVSAAALVAGGLAPAPMVMGSKKATKALSDPCPGPQVPSAFAGRAVNRLEREKAMPKSPMQTRVTTAHRGAGERVMIELLSCP